MEAGKTIGKAGVIGLMLSLGCIDPYHSTKTDHDVHFLVVDGLYGQPDGSFSVSLSRSRPLSASDSLSSETAANVQIEKEEDSSLIQMWENSPGVYSAWYPPLENGKNYRLRIETQNGILYLSDFEPFKQTPPIDSIHWGADSGQAVDAKFHVFVNAHDDSKGTNYYLWKYMETWSYHSQFRSYYKFENGAIVIRDLNDNTYNCWKSSPSYQIRLTSTTHLTEDVVSDFDLITMPLSSQKLVERYSVLVSQMALSEAGYLYWQELKKNNEELGTIFGPLPSNIVGNVHNAHNSTETVIGYVSFTTVQQRRFFVTYPELPRVAHTTGYEDCTMSKLLYQDVQYFSGSYWLLTQEMFGYWKTTQECADCRLLGGVTTKPDFW